MACGRLGIGAVAVCLLASGCTATSTRSYAEPLAYTRFAAQEACLTAGFQLTRVEPDELEGERPLRLGLLAGQGNEQVRVRLAESGSTTSVEITTEKRFLFFLTARHLDDRIAEYLDAYVQENRDLRERIAGAKP
jgi:hypothetical protein